MPTQELVALLTAERDKLNRAIEALSSESGPRRGRPAAKKAAASPSTEEPAGRHLSAASRRKMAQAQKRRWAAWRAAQKSQSKSQAKS